MREVVLDTETTGLNFKAGDRVIEVGCVELFNHVQTGKTLQFYCSVNKKIDEGATKIHGLTNDFLSSYPPFEEQVDSFLNFIKKDTLIIHNASFDVGFINNELRIMGKKDIENEIIDTVALARKKLNTRIANLDYLCKRFEIDSSKRDLHGALLDSQLLAEVYLELKGGKQISMNLNPIKINIIDQTTNVNPLNTEFLKIKLTQDEEFNHNQLIKRIKNPLWQKLTTKKR
jgi:DNA polymerase III subunit epsilon